MHVHFTILQTNHVLFEIAFEIQKLCNQIPSWETGALPCHESHMYKPEPQLNLIPIDLRGWRVPSVPMMTSLPYKLLFWKKRETWTDDDKEGDVEEDNAAEKVLPSTATHYILSPIEDTVSWIWLAVVDQICIIHVSLNITQLCKGGKYAIVTMYIKSYS